MRHRDIPCQPRDGDDVVHHWVAGCGRLGVRKGRGNIGGIHTEAAMSMPNTASIE